MDRINKIQSHDMLVAVVVVVGWGVGVGGGGGAGEFCSSEAHSQWLESTRPSPMRCLLLLLL